MQSRHREVLARHLAHDIRERPKPGRDAPCPAVGRRYDPTTNRPALHRPGRGGEGRGPHAPRERVGLDTLRRAAPPHDRACCRKHPANRRATADAVCDTPATRPPRSGERRSSPPVQSATVTRTSMSRYAAAISASSAAASTPEPGLIFTWRIDCPVPSSSCLGSYSAAP